jgi:hypothetical protein
VNSFDGAAEFRIAVGIGEFFHQSHVEGGLSAVTSDFEHVVL